MDPDELLRQVAVLLEEVCPRRHDRDTGSLEPIRRSEWLVLKERLDLMIAMNTPRVEVEDERTNCNA